MRNVMNPMAKRLANKQRKGFSLVELVVVILIIAILAAAIFLGGATVINQARESQVKSDLRNMATYVQDMLYENPDLQYHSKFAAGEGFTYDPTTKTFTYASETDATKENMEVMTKLLNANYLTADFQLGEVTDAWDNPYLFSYDQTVSQATGETSSCIVVISSMGVNTIDESSNGATAAGALKVADTFDTDMDAAVKGSAVGTTGVTAAGANKAYTSAEQFAALLGQGSSVYNTQDDYGVVIVMIDGEVSTAYYGF